MTRWVFSSTPDFSRQRVREALPADLRLGEGQRQNQCRTWVDTFDWRLSQKGLSAFFVRKAGRRYELTARAEDSGEIRATLSEAPGMAEGLPEGPLRDLLAPAIGIRRLLEQVTVVTRRELAALLDERDKTIGWLAIEDRSARSPGDKGSHEMSRRVVWTAVRGFDREVKSARGKLERQGLIVPDEVSEPVAALAAIGRAAGDYSSKRRFDLDPGSPATLALAEIFGPLLDTIEANEAGIAARLDIEFLHDYRVAVRRTRSALSHFGDALEPPVQRWAARFFSDLGRRTGAARDLDVMLLELPGYARRLPQARRRSLEAMAGRFSSDVVCEYASFSRWLASKTYRRGLDRWRREIDTLRNAPEDETIARVAARAIDETARKVFKQAKKIRKTDDDEPVHRLRIRCKKLRYVLEFSRSLTPGGEVAELITTLKRLQDVLGTFQDLVVHNPRMVATACREPADPELVLATGWLLAELDHRYGQVRREVDGTVERFRRDAPAVLARVLSHLSSDRA